MATGVDERFEVLLHYQSEREKLGSSTAAQGLVGDEEGSASGVDNLLW